MATWQVKSDLNIALHTVSSALDIVDRAMRRGDDKRLIFTEVDFMKECLNEQGEPDHDKMKETIGRIITTSPEKASVISERLSDDQIDHATFNVLKKRNDKARRLVKNEERADEIQVDETTWVITTKRDQKKVDQIIDELNAHPFYVRDADRLISASKDPLRGFELTTIRNVNPEIIDMMADKKLLTSVYATNRQKDGRYTIAIPSNEKDDFIRNLYASIGHIAGTEEKLRQQQLKNRYTFEDKHMLRAKDSRKPFFVADLNKDGTFSEGVIIDKAGARRVIFEKDNTYVVESYKRESSHFDFQAAYLIGKYDRPGYLELSGEQIRRDDIMKAQDRIQPENTLPPVSIDNKRQLAITNKNYIVQHYLSPVMQEIVSDTLRESALGRIRDAKWHALENGLSNEAAELGRDEAEGSASVTPKTKGTLRGIDMGTVNHEGFNSPDEFCFKTREEFGRAIGLNDAEMKLSGLLTKTDDAIDRMINSSYDMQKMTLEEVGYFYDAVKDCKDIEYEELMPDITRELLVPQQEREIQLAKQQDRSENLLPDNDEPERDDDLEPER